MTRLIVGEIPGAPDSEKVPGLRTFKRRGERRQQPKPAEVGPINRNKHTPNAKSATEPTVKPKIAKKKQLSQTHLDLGQRNFHSTRCSTCGLIFTPGSGDTVLVKDGNQGNVVRLAQVPSKELKALKDLAAFLEEQLGLPPDWLLAVPTIALLYVCNTTRAILGAIFAERIDRAWNATSSNTQGDSSLLRHRDPLRKGIIMADKDSSVKAQCGIRMMWTSQIARRKGVATKLMDCVRSQLAFGVVLSRDKIAFSQPTPEGTAFIQSYVGSCDFLVYGGFEGVHKQRQ